MGYKIDEDTDQAISLSFHRRIFSRNDLEQYFLVTQVTLHPLSQSETHTLVRTFTKVGKQNAESDEELREVDLVQRVTGELETTSARERARLVVRLGEVLFAHTERFSIILVTRSLFRPMRPRRGRAAPLAESALP